MRHLGASPEMRMIVDPQAMVAPLLAAVPRSKAITCCGACGQRIDGLARIDDHGMFVHPDECPAPAPPAEAGRATPSLFDLIGIEDAA